MRIGDAANIFVLANTGAFLAFVIADSFGAHVPGVSPASESFQRDGFCVANAGTLLDSHVMCFYVDTVAAILLTGLARFYAEHPAVKGSVVAAAAAGIFAHGCGHLGFWADALGLPQDSATPPILSADWSVLGAPTLAIRLAGGWLFFFLLLNTLPSMGRVHAAAHGLWAAAVGTLFVPPIFGFTYVQTVLLWLAAAYELRRKSKDRWYDLTSLLINVPVGCVAWAEALACDEVLGQRALTFKSIGGHVWYDSTIPLSMLAYYAAAVFADSGAAAGKAKRA